MPSKLRRLPDQGDRLLHVESGIWFVVVKRISENRLIARREDGLEVTNGTSPYGYPPDHMLMNEAIWLLRHNIFVLEVKP